jgi:nucleoside-diphosphate-sugar epimerase
MKALVTGSEGFVARHLIPKLHAAGIEVVGTEDMLPWLKTALAREERFDLVFHLAAKIVNVDARMHGGMEMYGDMELDLAMCRYLELHPPSKCAVLMSSCAVDYPADPYCIVKRNLESFATTLAKKDVPVVVLRPFSGYGSDQSQEYPFPAILGRAMRREDPLTVWGGEQVRDWVHVDDLVNAMMLATEYPRLGVPIEVGTGIGTSLNSLAEMMAEEVGYKPIIESVDKACSSRYRVSGQNGQWTAQAFGWTPLVSLREGIAQSIRELSMVEA